MTLYVGIEGIGARQSVAVCADEHGRILAHCRLFGEPLTLNATDRRTLRSRLCRLLREITKQLGLTLTDLAQCVVCVGLSGVTCALEAHEELLDELQQLEIAFRKLIVTGDAEIVLVSHAQSLTGSVILCGTDCAAYVSSGTAGVRVGGWGTSIGDEGSGYWIGDETIRAIVEECDAGTDPSILWREVESWLTDPAPVRDYPEWQLASIIWLEHRQRQARTGRANDPRATFLRFASSMSIKYFWEWRAIVSALAIPTMSAWNKADGLATRIMGEAASHLAAKYRCARKRLGADSQPWPLVIYGGALTHHPDFSERVISQLGEGEPFPQTILTPRAEGTMRPVCGALLYALGESRTGELRLPVEEVVHTLREKQSALHREGELKND